MKKRYHLLDMLRGICIILVVIYHIIYNLSEVFGGRYAFFRSDGMNVFRDCFVGVLIVISGISCSLSRSNLNRGIKTLGCGLLITAVTAIAMPSELITFGILHFFGICMLLYSGLARFFAKVPITVGTITAFVLYFLTKNIFYSVHGLPKSFLLYVLGFNTGFYSADYYPLLPWIFLFFVGCFLGRLFKENMVPRIFEANPIKPLSFIGRHTMLIYLIHQPIIFGGMWIWFNIIPKL